MENKKALSIRKAEKKSTKDFREKNRKTYDKVSIVKRLIKQCLVKLIKGKGDKKLLDFINKAIERPASNVADVEKIEGKNFEQLHKVYLKA